MERKEEHNPTPKSWSELPTHLLSLVFERLSFANFQRAKSVCSFWHSASKQSVPKKQIHHWLILFPKDDEDSSFMLFNPEEKDKLYKTRLEFTKSTTCIAIYGSWLLMRDPLRNLYIVNIFTPKDDRINLPPFESQLGMITMERTQDDNQLCITSKRKPIRGIGIRCPVFWIDEKTKDYVVLWGLSELCVVYSKNGDRFWNQIPYTSDPYHMVFKDYKLYYLSLHGFFKIFDFSSGNPQVCFCHGCIMNTPRLGRQLPPGSNPLSLIGTKLVVTVTGQQVLKVEIRLRRMNMAWSLRVFSVCSSGFEKTHELVSSLGDEAILLDQGVTVMANEGFIRNCIYFSHSDDKNRADMLIFNLETRKTELIHTFDSSSV